MNNLQSFTHLWPSCHASTNWFSFQLFSWTVPNFHQYVKVLRNIDLPLKITESNIMRKLAKILNNLAYFCHDYIMLQCLLHFQPLKTELSFAEEALSNLPTVRDMQLCVCTNGEMPTPPPNSFISDWLLTGRDCGAKDDNMNDSRKFLPTVMEKTTPNTHLKFQTGC